MSVVIAEVEIIHAKEKFHIYSKCVVEIFVYSNVSFTALISDAEIEANSHMKQEIAIHYWWGLAIEYLCI